MDLECQDKFVCYGIAIRPSMSSSQTLAAKPHVINQCKESPDWLVRFHSPHQHCLRFLHLTVAAAVAHSSLPWRAFPADLTNPFQGSPSIFPLVQIITSRRLSSCTFFFNLADPTAT